MKAKRISALILIAAMVLGITACGGSKKETAEEPAQETAVEEEKEEVKEEETKEEEAAEEPAGETDGRDRLHPLSSPASAGPV